MLPAATYIRIHRTHSPTLHLLTTQRNQSQKLITMAARTLRLSLVALIALALTTCLGQADAQLPALAAKALLGVAPGDVNDIVEDVLHNFNLANEFRKNWIAPTGDKRCNAEAQSSMRIFYGIGIGSFVTDKCNKCDGKSALSGVKCMSKPRCSIQGAAVTKALKGYTEAIDSNTYDYVLVQEACKKIIEVLAAAQLKYAAPLTAERRLISCVHSYAKELAEDTIETDNNKELLNLYIKLTRKI